MGRIFEVLGSGCVNSGVHGAFWGRVVTQLQPSVGGGRVQLLKFTGRGGVLKSSPPLPCDREGDSLEDPGALGAAVEEAAAE